MAFLLALISGASWGTADFLGGLMTRRLGVLVVGVVSQTAGLVVLATIVVISGDPMPDGSHLAYGVAGGLFAAVGLGALYQGLAVGPMSIVAPITALEVLVPLGVGIARGERPGPLQVAGIVFAVLGVVLAARETAADEPGARIGRGVIYAIVAAVALGLLVTLLREAGQESASWAALTVRSVSMPLFLIAMLVTRGWHRRPTRSETGAMVATGAFDSAANVTFAVAGQTGLLSIVSVLGALYPVATVLLARSFLHERLTRSQWAGVTLAFVGVALIALG